MNEFRTIEIVAQDTDFLLCSVDDEIFVKFIFAPIVAAHYFKDTLIDNVFVVEEITIKFGYFILEENHILVSVEKLPSLTEEIEWDVIEALEALEAGENVILGEKKYTRQELLMWGLQNENSSTIN